MSERSEAWGRFCEMQDTHREREDLPPFDANLHEYPAMMAGFYVGWDAAKTDLSKVTRVTVVDLEHGRSFEKYGIYNNGAEIHLQDDGRTLKIFPRTPSTGKEPDSHE